MKEAAVPRLYKLINQHTYKSTVTWGDLHTDDISMVLGYLKLSDIMSLRLVSKNMLSSVNFYYLKGCHMNLGEYISKYNNIKFAIIEAKE